MRGFGNEADSNIVRVDKSVNDRSNIVTREQANKIVRDILDDMRGRAGGDWWFGSLDDDIKDEIFEKWIEIVLKGAE